MSFSVNLLSLTALNPVEFTYEYGRNEVLAKESKFYTNGVAYNKYTIFNDFKDSVLSKKNGLVLTDVKDLNTIFDQQDTSLSLGTFTGSMYLQGQNNKYISFYNKQIVLGGVGPKLLFTIVPVDNTYIQIKTSTTEYIQVDEEYPYTARVSEETLPENQAYRRKFIMEYGNGQVSFKIQTKDGSRFLSYGADRILRAVGLELNETVVNPYRFKVELVSSDTLSYDFIPSIKEIKYFNDFASLKDRKTVALKDIETRDTNLLVSYPTKQAALSGKANINISILKTNVDANGVYSPTF